MRYPQKSPLPEPLPPERRTVGQLIAESIKLYQRHFWIALLLGLATIPPNLIASANGGVRHERGALLVLLLAQAPCFAAAYVGASIVVLRRSLAPRRILSAYALALALYLVAAPMIWILVLPGLAWLALTGLAVPALVGEELGLVPAFRRGVELARADYAHVLGGICALVLVFLVTRGTLATLLHSQAGGTARVAGMIADVVLFPLVFLGSALLYVDQEARVRLRGAEAAALA